MDEDQPPRKQGKEEESSDDDESDCDSFENSGVPMKIDAPNGLRNQSSNESYMSTPGSAGASDEKDVSIQWGSFKIQRKDCAKASLRSKHYPDHTYNGVAFNVEVKKSSESFIFVTGFTVRGQLGRVQVFALPDRDVNKHKTDPTHWKVLHDAVYQPSIDDEKLIELKDPYRIMSGKRCGFYIHTDRQHDDGLMYRSCIPGKVMEDRTIEIHHGWAHTSRFPFDEQHGWFRPNRVLTGSVYYSQVREAWTPQTNHYFSHTYKTAVKCIVEIDPRACCLPPEALLAIVAFCPLIWFDRKGEEPSQRFPNAKDHVDKQREEMRRLQRSRPRDEDYDDEGGYNQVYIGYYKRRR